MNSPDDILRAASVIPAHQRVPMLCRAAGLTYTAIERKQGLGRGSISSYATGQQYAYPRLRKALCVELAERLNVDRADVAACLFSELEAAAR